MANTKSPYSQELRRKAAQMHNEGKGYKIISRELGIDRGTVRSWIRRYQLYGEESFTPYWHKDSENSARTAAKRLASEREVVPYSHLTDSETKDSEILRLCTSIEHLWLSLTDIARKYGIEEETLRNFLFLNKPNALQTRSVLRNALGYE